ncbi:neuronal acetylcholine receptor subunit alpha-6-like [Babylonia areolata]|uniref:neuronal acetylcholine receptor subunit alpha-6-like n=1 Tax=Babylonia areolata TaxID=304850 RepID=UPI003FD04ED1
MERGVDNWVVVVVMVAAVMMTCLLHCGRCQGGDNGAEKYQEEAGQIYTTVFHKYKKNVRPPDSYPAPVPVTVHVTLIHIRGLDVLKQEMESIIDLQIEWQDKRLAWYANKVEMITDQLSQVWHPSVVYLNGAVPPSPLFSSKVSISKDGLITWKRREVVTTVCPTLPRNASQLCDVSLGFTSPETVEVFDNLTTFTIVPDFSNHHWDIVGAHVDAEDTQVLRFLLELEQLNPEVGSPGMKNCSGDLAYLMSSGGARGAVVGEGGWRVVGALVVSWWCCLVRRLWA